PEPESCRTISLTANVDRERGRVRRNCDNGVGLRVVPRDSGADKIVWVTLEADEIRRRPRRRGWLGRTAAVAADLLLPSSRLLRRSELALLTCGRCLSGKGRDAPATPGYTLQSLAVLVHHQHVRVASDADVREINHVDVTHLGSPAHT